MKWNSKNIEFIQSYSELVVYFAHVIPVVSKYVVFFSLNIKTHKNNPLFLMHCRPPPLVSSSVVLKHLYGIISKRGSSQWLVMTNVRFLPFESHSCPASFFYFSSVTRTVWVSLLCLLNLFQTPGSFALEVLQMSRHLLHKYSHKKIIIKIVFNDDSVFCTWWMIS